jgi:hypothetical protein
MLCLYLYPSTSTPGSTLKWHVFLWFTPGTFRIREVLTLCLSRFNRGDHSVLALCNKAVDYYRDELGYTVVPIEIPYVPEGQIAHAFTSMYFSESPGSYAF